MDQISTIETLEAYEQEESAYSAYAELGPIRTSTPISQPVSKKPVSAPIKRLIAELSLRYQPSAQADLLAHGARRELLAADLTSCNPIILGMAIDLWVARSPFMPKASELLELYRSELSRALPPVIHLAEPYCREIETKLSASEVIEANALMKSLHLDTRWGNDGYVIEAA